MSDLNWVCYGAGVNSTAMIIEMLRRGESIAVITFADTIGERPETYSYLRYFGEWLIKQHGLWIWSVSNEDTGPLYDDLFSRKALPSVAYDHRMKSCSDKAKIRPQRKFIREWMPERGVEVINRCIGIHADEDHRIQTSDAKWAVNRWPLIEYGMDQQDCVEAIKAAGLAVPPKSSCFYCPNSTPREIIELRNKHPDLYHRAIELERNASLTTIKGLGTDWAWEHLEETLDMPFVKREGCMSCLG